MTDNLEFIVEQLQQQQVVAYPTEAVFGLGCDPDSQLAVEHLLQLKQRSWEKGLILIAANYEQLQPYIDDTQLTAEQRMTMFSSWPGPVTWVIPARPSTPKWLTGQFDSLAVRVSDHLLVRELCQAFGKPLVSTSANLSGLEPCKTEHGVLQQFGDNFPVLKGLVGGREKPSEIRDVLTGKLYRQG
ncbi:L-threonylcarbamoyladenylate synthase type 1 TsaC [Limnobaculum zhutongyuii]|uniref:Threonylcarbamoyl-AMP synthase n=1 Tax=Limnobaculum zhutongyuii TaxID=2498113 RepID=A0A411WPR0_9GAMM|nr:L-threonylcarbamoyladenylate synthase type 1 TsaC [Limnobaculum zhutongyuii]QBH98178.1 L-threonylcarbamoyladenylate synthase type 1 TsaC [Limnobaculum zhutongyuii]TQS86270.1 L-threonylcarbamoyladenylate synthase type 1 TsaC [Limnobaculum zhutongyuii]